MNDGNETPSLQNQEGTPTISAEETTPKPEGEESKPESLLDKPAEEQKEPAPAPDPLTAETLAFPEDVEVNEELRDEFLGVMNDAEMSSKDRAQALVDLQMKVLKQASEESSKAWTDMQEEWKTAVKADPEIGGERLQPALEKIGRLVNEYGSDELLEAMAITGAGNNPHVIRFLSKVANKLTEGGPINGSPPEAPKDAAAKMYPSMKG